MSKDASNGSAVTEDGRKLPFTKEEMFTELREIILREGARIDLMRGRAAAKAFLGFDYEADEHDDGSNNYSQEHLQKIRLDDFELARNFGLAYDYAFQVGKWMQFDEVVENRLRGIAHAMPQWGVEGSQTPYHASDSTCRHVAELATARYLLTHYHHSPSIEQLALLANMTQAAVRNSLSQENIKAEGKPAQVENEAAWEWLSKRRGFIPNKALAERKETPQEKTQRIFNGVSFTNGLRHAAIEAGFNGDDTQISTGVSSAAGIDKTFVEGLIGGYPAPELTNLKAVADTLGLYYPRFAALAVEIALAQEGQ